MAKGSKRDRVARLLKVLLLLAHNGNGCRVGELALACDVCKRTAYRDIIALDRELGVPVWQDNGRYGVAEGYFLKPIKLSLSEAIALFLSARLMARYSDERDMNIEQAFCKLAAVLPEPISSQVMQTALSMAEKPLQPRYTRTFEMLAHAWAYGRTVRIWYPSGGVGKPAPRFLDPYYIEPSAIGHACYVIGRCHTHGAVRTFKVERITGIEMTEASYDIPADFNIQERLRHSWGVVADDEPTEVRLRFTPRVARRVQESTWHASQRVETQRDGSLLFIVKVDGTMEIKPWILSWGDQVEVLEPSSLRHDVAAIADRMADRYAASLL